MREWEWAEEQRQSYFRNSYHWAVWGSDYVEFRNSAERALKPISNTCSECRMQWHADSHDYICPNCRSHFPGYGPTSRPNRA